MRTKRLLPVKKVYRLIDQDYKIHVIGLDSAVQDIIVHDIAVFIRRILYKEAYKWDFEIVREIIETYNSSLKLTIEELGAILAIIIFPHKFWKLGMKKSILEN